ncbi:MAG: ABC transporter permease, partial [Gemmatimonadaceae bacterium]
MGSLATDVRAAVRALRRTPASTFAGILALAVGIGGTTTMLGVVDAIDVRSLPFERPEQLLSLKEIAPTGSQYCHPVRGCESSWTSRVTIDDWRAARSIADIAGYRLYEETRWIHDRTSSESIQAIEVTGNFFSLLGVRPYLGRLFEAQELVTGGAPAVVLSYDFWRARFGSDRGVVGSVLTLSD